MNSVQYEIVFTALFSRGIDCGRWIYPALWKNYG